MAIFRKSKLLVAGGALLAAALVLGTIALPALAQTSTANRDGGQGGGQAHAGPGTSMMGGAGGMMGRSGMGGMMGDIERHFIIMMIPHHQAAVEMADLALLQAQHQELKDLAANIKQVQTAEIDQMRIWYSQWYGTAVPAGPGNQGGMMGGYGMMAESDMFGNLRDLTNAADFDKAFIAAMIPHHRMAVMMAQMIPAQGAKPELRSLAQSISSSQSAQIEQMQQWYEQWFSATPQ